MPQHDYNIANAAGASVRSDVNNALSAIVSWNSGTAPGTTFADMRWIDTATGTVKRRNAANTGWILESTRDESRVLSRSSNTILDVSDIGKAIIATGSFTQTFDAAATLGDGWKIDYHNDGSGYITLDPNSSEQINGATTLILSPGDSCRIVCTGSAFKAIMLGQWRAGDMKDHAGTTVQSGWLACDGASYATATHPNLFAAIGYAWGGSGANFNVPDYRDRATIGPGTGTVLASGVDADVDLTNNTLAVASNSTKWITGMPVVFTLASGTITGLTHSTTYYVIRASATTIKLASSLENAQNLTAIDLTAKSSPVWTITHTFTARTVGEMGGEEAHAQNIDELLKHLHTYDRAQAQLNQKPASSGTIPFDLNVSTNSGTKGGNTAMNIMGPFGVATKVVKL